MPDSNPEPTTALQVRVDKTVMEKIEVIAQECKSLLAGAEVRFQRTFTMAAAIRQIGDLITDEMMSDIMLLQGSPLGFVTDKDKEGGYPVDIVKRCVIEGTLRGFLPVNNEMNIIAGRFMGVKNGFMRLVREFPGLTNLEEAPSAPEIIGETAYVPYVAAWQLNGTPMQLQRLKQKTQDGTVIDNRIIVRVNKYMSFDGALGKAKRKMYAAIYDRLTGSQYESSEGEADDVIDIDVEGKPVTQRGRLQSLFDGPAEGEAGESAPDQAKQDELVTHYHNRLLMAGTKTRVSEIAKEAAADKRLTPPSMKDVMDDCTARRKTVSKPLTKPIQPATESGSASDKGNSMHQDRLVGEYRKRIEKAGTDEEVDVLFVDAKDDPTLAAVSLNRIKGACEDRRREL